MIYEYMIPIYAYLIKAKARTLEDLPTQYKIIVAEYLAREKEEKNKYKQ